MRNESKGETINEFSLGQRDDWGKDRVTESSAEAHLQAVTIWNCWEHIEGGRLEVYRNRSRKVR